MLFSFIYLAVPSAIPSAFPTSPHSQSPTSTLLRPPSPTLISPSFNPTQIPTLPVTSSIITIPVTQTLVGITQTTFESSNYAKMAFTNTVLIFLGTVQGVIPQAVITSDNPTPTRRALRHFNAVKNQNSFVSESTTGVEVLYNVAFILNIAISDSLITSLTSSIKTSLTAATSQVSKLLISRTYNDSEVVILKKYLFIRHYDNIYCNFPLIIIDFSFLTIRGQWVPAYLPLCYQPNI
jgi:hypothetical protein